MCILSVHPRGRTIVEEYERGVILLQGPENKCILKAMPALTTAAVRRELERILASPGFAHNQRMSQFLRFVVDQHLGGRTDELKESVIAVEVFGRSPAFNPKRDPIVRTEAARLRARLNEYYWKHVQADSVIIELP